MTKKIAKYLISGGTSAAVNMAVVYVLTDLVGVWYLYSSVTAFFISAVVNFSLQKFWTFEEYSRDRMRKQAFLFLFLLIGNILINAALVYVLVSILGVWYLLAQVVTIALLTIINFYLSQRFIFHEA